MSTSSLLRLLTWFVAAALLLAPLGCTKKPDPAPAATTGSLEGTVSPAGALTSVVATNAGGLTFPATPNATTGAFSLPNLAPGDYTLSFVPASGYVAPAPRTATVAAGQATAAGTVLVSGDGTPRGTVTWTKDGTVYTSTVLSGLIGTTNQTFFVEASAAGTGFTDYITLSIPFGLAAPGPYNLSGNSSPYSNTAGYRRTTGATTVSYTTALRQTSSTTGINGSGTLVVNSYDAANRTMSGTFVFNAYNVDNGINNVTRVDITNGTFNLRF